MIAWQRWLLMSQQAVDEEEEEEMVIAIFIRINGLGWAPWTDDMHNVSAGSFHHPPNNGRQIRARRCTSSVIGHEGEGINRNDKSYCT